MSQQTNVSDKSGVMWTDAVVAYFTVLFR